MTVMQGEIPVQILRCNTFSAQPHLLRCSLKHDTSAGISAIGAEINDPVAVFNQLLVVFHDDHGVSGISKAVQEYEEMFDIPWMKAGCGLIQQIEVPPV